MAGSRPGAKVDIDQLLKKATSALQMDAQDSFQCESCAEESEFPSFVLDRFFSFCSGGGSTATMYCKNCGGYLCASCDARLHPAGNLLMRKHQRVPVDSIRHFVPLI